MPFRDIHEPPKIIKCKICTEKEALNGIDFCYPCAIIWAWRKLPHCAAHLDNVVERGKRWCHKCTKLMSDASPNSVVYVLGSDPIRFYVKDEDAPDGWYLVTSSVCECNKYFSWNPCIHSKAANRMFSEMLAGTIPFPVIKD